MGWLTQGDVAQLRRQEQIRRPVDEPCGLHRELMQGLDQKPHRGSLDPMRVAPRVGIADETVRMTIIRPDEADRQKLRPRHLGPAGLGGAA